MQNSVHLPIHTARLIRRLAEMDSVGRPVPAHQFTERVGALLDLSGAVALSNMLGGLAQPHFESTCNTPATIKEMVLKEHQNLVRHIVKRFVPRTGPARNGLPSLAEFYANCRLKGVFSMGHGEKAPNCAAAFAPYRQLYLFVQGKLARATHRLRTQVAEAVAGLSPGLAGLAALDTGIGETFYLSQQTLMDRIPFFLEQHFNHLLQINWQTLPKSPEMSDLAPWMASGGWVEDFCSQMQELLLAELELRLQPVLGMVEAACGSGIDG